MSTPLEGTALSRHLLHDGVWGRLLGPVPGARVREGCPDYREFWATTQFDPATVGTYGGFSRMPWITRQKTTIQRPIRCRCAARGGHGVGVRKDRDVIWFHWAALAGRAPSRPRVDVAKRFEQVVARSFGAAGGPQLWSSGFRMGRLGRGHVTRPMLPLFWAKGYPSRWSRPGIIPAEIFAFIERSRPVYSIKWCSEGLSAVSKGGRGDSGRDAGLEWKQLQGVK